MKKILALYLPQYHSIPENDLWWGKGYTEWTAVKNAKPLFKNHYQPKVPLDKNYYNLAEENANTWRWQANLASIYGVYGFAIYHYWFGEGRQLLEKPAEILLKNKDIAINYCFVWANESWTKTWYGLEKETLVEQKYGDKDEWERHFSYLLKFFNDERYIKVNGKPVIYIYRSTYIHDFENMVKTWTLLAKSNGFPGIHIVVANSSSDVEKRVSVVDAFYNFEPSYTMTHKMNCIAKQTRKIKILFRSFINMFLKQKILERVEDAKPIYKTIEKSILDYSDSKTIYFGTFPMWDNTPRRGYKGLFFKNTSANMFYKSLKFLYEHANDDSFIIVNAWNEWGEGCFLEPDEKYGYAFLEAIKRVVQNE